MSGLCLTDAHNVSWPIIIESLVSFLLENSRDLILKGMGWSW